VLKLLGALAGDATSWFALESASRTQGPPVLGTVRGGFITKAPQLPRLSFVVGQPIMLAPGGPLATTFRVTNMSLVYGVLIH
jgi:hypothetical protein